MKLLARYNRVNIFTAILILLVSSAAYYNVIHSILIEQLDKDLKVEEEEINEFIEQNHSLPMASAYKGQIIKFAPAEKNAVKHRIQTLSAKEHAEDDDAPIRMLTFPVEVNGKTYTATVIKSQVEAEDLLEVIVMVTAGIILILLVVISFINRLFLVQLWKPFYKTLDQLKNFDVNKAKPLEFTQTNLQEFNELNRSVSEMTKKVNDEFLALKTFTENASHEMQTPLAIINSKLDLLSQHASENESEQIQAIYNAISRLSRLNQTLLLLTKINNDQFNQQQQVNLKKLLENKFKQFDELIKSKSILVETDLQDVCVNMNEELADILINNLLSNAVKHNFVTGYIKCTLTPDKLTINNKGPELTFDKNQIFKRFQRNSTSKGTGLGLAVAQQICESSGFTIAYMYIYNEHNFTILLNEHNSNRHY